MRPLFLLWGCLVLPGYGSLVGPKEISGFEGDTVTVTCTYGEEQKGFSKYWCRDVGILVSRCSTVYYASEDGRVSSRDRVSILDSRRNLTLTVTLRALTQQDAGLYMCGISRMGLDHTFRVSLHVFSGPCCPASPLPSSQPLPTRSPQPKANAWQTQPPGLTVPALHTPVVEAKQGNVGAEASPSTGAALHGHEGASPRTASPPSAETSPHTATSPPAGTSHLATQSGPAAAKDASLTARSSSGSRTRVPLVRILAPVLVLLTLLLFMGLVAIGRCALKWKKEAQLAEDTPEKEKVQLSHVAMGNSWVPEYSVINLAGPTEPGTSAKPPGCLYTEVQRHNQNSEQGEVSSQDPEQALTPGPPLHVSGQESGFIPV